MLVLLVVIFFAASVSVFREFSFPIGGTEMTLSGLFWIMMAGLITLRLLGARARVLVPGYLWPFIALAGWAAVRWVLTPTGFRGLKDVLWYSMPVFFGLFVPLVLGKDASRALMRIRRIEKAFLFSVFIPIALFALALGTGMAQMTWQGPMGRFVDARGIPLYLLVVLAVALANWRYGPGKIRGRVLSLVSLGAIFLSVGRMVSILGLTLLAIAWVNPRRKWQILCMGSVVAIVTFYAITNIPVMQKRFFWAESWDPSEGLTSFNLMGRDRFWPAVYASASHEPLLGHGLGTARVLVGQFFVDEPEFHPHNEYLQVWHDLGIVGLFLLFLSWGGVFIRNWKMWARGSNSDACKWGMVSTLATGAVLVSSLTDNTLHYPFVIVPTMIVVGIASWLQSYKKA